jgi:hypothetical protein
VRPDNGVMLLSDLATSPPWTCRALSQRPQVNQGFPPSRQSLEQLEHMDVLLYKSGRLGVLITLSRRDCRCSTITLRNAEQRLIRTLVPAINFARFPLGLLQCISHLGCKSLLGRTYLAFSGNLSSPTATSYFGVPRALQELRRYDDLDQHPSRSWRFFHRDPLETYCVPRL